MYRSASLRFRILSALLAVCMVTSLLPVPAMAVSAQAESAAYSPLYQEVAVRPGQLVPDTCEITENEIYGYVMDYALQKGHRLSVINTEDTNYVFSVLKLVDGNYSTMLKSATAASFTATEDMPGR